MLCGQDDCDVEDVNNCKLAGIQHMIEYDPSLLKIKEFRLGTEAWHNENGDWVFTPLPAEETQ